MKRKIIRIDEEKCDGCGQCAVNCPEGALQIIEGKARIISEICCDGLGACIGYCPQGAITVEEREAKPYDEEKTLENIIKAGPQTIKAHLRHLYEHQERKYLQQAVAYLQARNIAVPDFQAGAEESVGQCPGSRMMNFRGDKPAAVNTGAAAEVPSQLQQWPVQLALINPQNSCFDEADILLTADCVPVAFGDFHRRFLKNKIIILLCPKLDSAIDRYIEKLAVIFTSHHIKSVTVTRMEVPCCGGINTILSRALEKAGVEIPVIEFIMSIRGDIITR